MTLNLVAAIPAELPAPFRPALVAGPILIGGLVSILFVGCNLVLCHTYFGTFFKSDKRWVKSAVVTVFSMDITHFVLTSSLLYNSFITNWASPTPFMYFDAHWAVYAFISCFVHIAVQSLFVHRVKQLTKRVYIWGPCLLFFGVRIVGLAALGFIIPTHSSLTMNQITDTFSVIGTTCLCFGVAGDLLVAGSLSYCLWTASSHSVGPWRSNLATQVLIFVIQTGLLTSISSTIYLITLLVWPHDFLVWGGMSLIVPRVYSISLTASLNHRKHLRKIATPRDQLSLWETAQFEQSRRAHEVVDLEFAEVEMTQTPGSTSELTRSVSVLSGGTGTPASDITIVAEQRV